MEGGRAFRGAWHLTAAEASARFCETCFLEKPYFFLCHSEQSESTLLSFMSL